MHKFVVAAAVAFLVGFVVSDAHAIAIPNAYLAPPGTHSPAEKAACDRKARCDEGWQWEDDQCIPCFDPTIGLCDEVLETCASLPEPREDHYKKCRYHCADAERCRRECPRP